MLCNRGYMQYGRRSRSRLRYDVGLRGWLVLGLIAVGLLLLVAPPGLALFALLSLLAVLSAWKLRLWMDQRSPEENDDRDQLNW